MATLPDADGGRENREWLRAVLRHCAVVPRRNPRGSEPETSALPDEQHRNPALQKRGLTLL